MKVNMPSSFVRRQVALVSALALFSTFLGCGDSQSESSDTEPAPNIVLNSSNSSGVDMTLAQSLVTYVLEPQHEEFAARSLTLKQAV